MNKIIRNIIPIVLFLLFLTASQDSYAQITDSTQVKAMDVYPNPFVSDVTIQTNKIPDTIEEIAVYDALGNLVHVFEQTQWQEESFIWSGESSTGVSVSSGTYIFHIRTEDETESVVIQKI